MNESAQPLSTKSINHYRRRPGPFGPARDLLPSDQQILCLGDRTSARDAIERMVDHRYSQIPVIDASNRIIGVFTWKSFGKRVMDLAATKIKPTELAIRDAMEPARFINPDVYIDTETDWGDIDHVLVGNDSDLIGILSVSDVFGRLNDFAEAFVLLYEIEHEIRDLIRTVATDERLKQMIAGMSLPPNARPPATLEDFTFNQYKGIITARSNWPLFEPVFDTMRELVDADFSDVSDLRNVVFHFRRGITPKDTDRLRRFRDKLRYDRELYAHQAENGSDGRAKHVDRLETARSSTSN